MKKVNSRAWSRHCMSTVSLGDRFVYRNFFCYGVYRVFFGVSVGGRTGLTAVVVGLLFLWLSSCRRWREWCQATLQLAPDLRWRVDDLKSCSCELAGSTESVPAFITAVMMPFSFSITKVLRWALSPTAWWRLVPDVSWSKPVRNHRCAAVYPEDCVIDAH